MKTPNMLLAIERSEQGSKIKKNEV